MAELGAGGGSSYPGTLDTDSSLEVDSPNASKTKARAACMNDANAAIVAIQTELGTDPAGSLTNVKTFLQTEHEADGTHKSITVADAITSTLATGTAPLVIASTTKVANLNADLLDDLNTATASTISTIAARDASGNLTAKQLISDIADGTAPLIVTSTTKVDNLNVDTVDGYEGAALLNPTTQNVVTGSRDFGTVYQNTNGKPMFVAVQGANSVANTTYQAYTDSSNPPTTIVTESVIATSGGQSAELFFIVLPSNYYKVAASSGTPTLNRWTEWY